MIVRRRVSSLLGLMAATALCFFAATAMAQTELQGAGATFPYPLYSVWFNSYSKSSPDVRFAYQPIGSGGGIKSILGRSVDFAATDKFLSTDELKQAPAALLHIPTVIGAVAVTYNIPDFGDGLRLTPAVLGDIFLGKITAWNDPRIATLNKGLTLPARKIVVIHRSDASGTTSIFTEYLAKVHAEWSKRVGKGTTVPWPVGSGEKGNDGIAKAVKRTPWSISYTEMTYAFQAGLPFAWLKNSSGVFVEPSIPTIRAAARRANKSISPDLRISLIDQPGRDSYPIVGMTWIVLYRQQGSQEKRNALADFLKWGLGRGQDIAKELYYAPLPENIRAKALKLIESI